MSERAKQDGKCLEVSRYGCQCMLETGHAGDHDPKCGWGNHKFSNQTVGEAVGVSPAVDKAVTRFYDRLAVARPDLGWKKPSPQEEKKATEPDPCPFCGGEGEMTYSNDKSYWYVGCINEDCMVQPETGLCPNEEQALVAWNWSASKADSAPSRSEIADAKRIATEAMDRADRLMTENNALQQEIARLKEVA